MISAQELVEHMQKNVGVPWQSQHPDGFSDGILLGGADTNVMEIVTTFAPTLDVLRKAVASTNNTVICREAPFYSGGERTLCFGGVTATKELTDRDAVCRTKQKFISKNNLVIVRFFDNWDNDKPYSALPLPTLKDVPIKFIPLGDPFWIPA